MSQMDAADKSFIELKSQESTGDKLSGKPETQESIEDQSSVETVAQESTKDISSSDPYLQESIRDMSSDELKPRESTAVADVKSQDNATGLGKPQSPVSAADPGEEKSHVKTTDKYFSEETTSAADISVQSQESTIDMSLRAEKSQENVKKNALGEPASEAGITVKPSGDEVSQERNMSSGGTQVNAKEIPLHDQKPQTVTAGKNLTLSISSFGEEKSQVNITEKASGSSATDKFTAQPESQESNVDKSASKQEPQIRSIEEQGYHNEELSQGMLPYSGAKPKTSTYSGKLESKMGDIDGQSSSEEITEMQSTESQENKKDNFSYGEDSQESELKHRKTKTESSPYSGDTTGNVSDSQSQKSSRRHCEPDGLLTSHSRATDTGFLLWTGAVIALMFLALCFMSREQQPPDHKDSPIDIFFKKFASVKNDFPGQFEGLWFRSEKLLQKHINMSDPSAPSILILTAARDGEQTLHCVSKRIAKSYADSFSKSWLMVDGLSKSKYDSATSKLQIDNELSLGFQSNSRAAVLYRLESLPPGSLLILYKYCDHENAAFKNVALVFTVLLEEQSLETDLSFTEVEEKVRDLFWERFANSGVSTHNEMDVDKLSGVWSRISHVVLPILPVASVESGSCPGIED